MKKLIAIIEGILVAAILGFVVAVAYLFFSKTFLDLEKDVLNDFLGAFTGAFFAFLFVRLGEAMTRVYDRVGKHRDALVKLQHYFNECLGIVGDNIYIADMYNTIFDGYTAEQQEARLFANEFHELPRDKELLLPISNMTLVNKVSVLMLELRKLNDTLKTINKMIAQTTQAFVDGRINHPTYVANIDHYRGSVAVARKFCVAAEKDIQEQFAGTRVLLQREPLLSKLYRLVVPKDYSKRQLAAIPGEIDKLEEEFQQIARESRERIQAIQSGANDEEEGT